MSATASDLDTEKFRKVHGLMMGGATPGERSAAEARAKAMAAKAGMTLKQAVSSLDAKTAAPKPANFFDGFEDWCEAREPGFKAERARKEAERERERAALREEAITEYGSEEAVWAETEHERLLRETLEPLADRKAFYDSRETYIDGYAGWTGRSPPLILREALARAYPFPKDIAGVWRERQEWERRQDILYAFEPGIDQPVWVRARLAALEHMLDTMAAPTFEGIEIRLKWLAALNERGYSRDQEEDARLIDALQFDFSKVRDRVEAGERNGAHKGGNDPISPSPASPKGSPHFSGHPLPRTNAEKRAAVLSMLDAHPEFSDREIARRLGVSPQTVNTCRKRR